MNRFASLRTKSFPYIIIAITYTLYVGIFTIYHDRMGIGIVSLAIIPVIGAGWYFGVMGGMTMAILSILANTAVLISEGLSYKALFESPGNLIGILSLIFIAIVFGRLGAVTRERQDAILRLEQYERDRQAHTEFLELLNEITGVALEANSLDATLKILVERIGKLFKADDCFFSLWDETKDIPLPIAAYGSMSDIFPYMQFQAGEQTLSVAVMKAGYPIAVTDIENSPHISPSVAAIYPSRSMLGLPLIGNNRKLGTLLLGYNKSRNFPENEIIHVQIAAEQIAQVLSKSLLLEEAHKQVKQLTALHDIALISIEVDSEDELINRVTDVIGQNLFLDNFGILLLDEPAGILRAHSSYRFFSSEELHMMDMPVGIGITGQVAKTGNAQRLGNVRRIKEYLEVDDRTISELCVPIKFRERILGVINAESTKRDAFTEDDERLLITLAGQIAIAIEQIRKAAAERKWLDQFAHTNDLIYALAQITTHIEKAFSIDDIIQNLGMELSKINLTCIMAAYDKEKGLLTIKYPSIEPKSLGIIENKPGFPLINQTFSRDKLEPNELFQPIEILQPVVENQSLLASITEEELSKILQEMGIGPETEPLCLSLTFEENLLGILWIWGDRLTTAHLPIMSIFAKQIGVSLERARLFQEVQSLALTDPLTGLQNRRSLFEVGRVEFARANRMNRTFSCMMLDLDHFKKVNDTYGHPIGDQALKEFANRCKRSVREIDLVGRYGGEELIILLPETDSKAAVQVAERLRSSIAARPFEVAGREIAVTVSVGVATKDENTRNLETLIARADQAMYIAKHRGRNQVALSK